MEKNYFTLSGKTISGGGADRAIYELSENDLKDYKLLGKAFGLDIYHCVYLGSKYNKHFVDRVYGYRILEDEDAKILSEVTGKKYISVEFFEKA